MSSLRVELNLNRSEILDLQSPQGGTCQRKWVSLHHSGSIMRPGFVDDSPMLLWRVQPWTVENPRAF
jgi:hypothetical protein